MNDRYKGLREKLDETGCRSFSTTGEIAFMPATMREDDVEIVFKRSTSPLNRFFNYLRELGDRIDPRKY